MPTTQPPRKRLRLTPPPEDADASNNHTSNPTSAPPAMTEPILTPPPSLPPCLPHLQSPYAEPYPPSSPATPEQKAQFNLHYLEWLHLDQAWRSERFLLLAQWLATWRETLVSMAFLCYESRHWAMREMGVQAGLVKPESRASLRRRVIEADDRELEDEMWRRWRRENGKG